MNAYRDEALAVGEWCFSWWNRDPASPSFGSFDRAYWGWKKKDFSDATLQPAVLLAIRYAESVQRPASLSPLLNGWVGFMRSIQHRNGSFDQCYPWERTPGVVYDVLSSLVAVRESPHLTDAEARATLEEVIERAVGFALRHDERHGEIANHFAHYAWELLHVDARLGNASARKQGMAYLDRTLSLFDKEEGWFREYDGADAGYQSRLLAYLTRIAELLDDEPLWNVCARAAGFVESMLAPDGGLHPMLGVRSTALLYPSGFERLAAARPEFAPLAAQMHAAWSSGAVPLPRRLDPENALRLAEDAAEAGRLRNMRGSHALADAPIPTRNMDLPRAGLHRRAGEGWMVQMTSWMGGAMVVHARDGRLAREDAGYLLLLADGTRWVTRRAGNGRAVAATSTEITVETAFVQSLHAELTTMQLVLLRILNATVLRLPLFDDLFRKLVVRRLIAGRRSLPIRLCRSITIGDQELVMADNFAMDGIARSRLEGGRLFRCRQITANHMASSRYFQRRELEGEQPWMEEVSLDGLDGRTLETRIRLDADRRAIDLAAANQP